LERFIEQVPTLSLQNIYISPLEALEDLDSGMIDVLFLDVHLPKISGVELLKSLKQAPQTILTTAFSEYAIEGFELDVVDYLLKPFSFERFLKSVSKLQKKGDANKSVLHRHHLFVRNNGQITKIATPDIEYVQAKGDFILIGCKGGSREVANISLQEMVSSLGRNFVRCHKSYIVNIDAIEKIVRNQVVIKDKRLPIGRTFKESLMEKINII